MAFEEMAGPAGSPRIEAIRGDRFIVGGQRWEETFLIWPGGVEAVDTGSVSELGKRHFSKVRDIRPARDVLLIGTGAGMQWPDFDLLTHLRDDGLGPEVMDSRAAARTYNLLLAEERMVAALILPPV